MSQLRFSRLVLAASVDSQAQFIYQHSAQGSPLLRRGCAGATKRLRFASFVCSFRRRLLRVLIKFFFRILAPVTQPRNPAHNGIPLKGTEAAVLLRTGGTLFCVFVLFSFTLSANSRRVFITQLRPQCTSSRSLWERNEIPDDGASHYEEK